jgi:translocator assembly and maintenance protein 41
MITTPDADDNDKDAASRHRLTHRLRESLPTDQIVAAFGYGSGVFSQDLIVDTEPDNENNEDPKVVDLIVVVRDAAAFHQANLVRNPSHYHAWMTAVVSNTAAAAWCTWWQRHPAPFGGRCNPGLYFCLTPTLKYGVVQVEDLVEDLTHWKYLYLAGRLQKPVLSLPLLMELNDNNNDSTPQQMVQASLAKLQQSVNLPAALASALLLLSHDDDDDTSRGVSPLPIPATHVFRQIASLSYLGDFRVRYGAEDPHKVTRLVEAAGQEARFTALYAEAAARLQAVGLLTIHSGPKEDGSSCGTGTTTTTTTSTTSTTPPTAQKIQGPQWSWDRSLNAQQLLAQHLPFCWDTRQQRQHSNALSQRLARIVAPAARYQSFKGIVTAGPYKAWQYAARKLSKGLLRR